MMYLTYDDAMEVMWLEIGDVMCEVVVCVSVERDEYWCCILDEEWECYVN